MKDDEQRFLIDVYQRCANNALHNPLTQTSRTTPRELINEPDFYMHYKRAWYLLEKWAGKGWYTWGVTMDLGWLEREGEEAAKNILRPKGSDSTATAQ